MTQPGHKYAALIVDMVGSRQSTDRRALQDRMSDVFDQIDQVTGVRPAFTIGDEFQVRYTSIAEAMLASLHLHLRSQALIRLRIGIGWGELNTEDVTRSPFGQDGPCWWRARNAIETLQGTTRGRAPGRRTALHTETAMDPLWNGYLVLRDTLLEGFDEVDTRLAIGLLAGRTQSDLAKELGINKASVSRRANNNGVLALVEAASIGSPPVPERP